MQTFRSNKKPISSMMVTGNWINDSKMCSEVKKNIQSPPIGFQSLSQTSTVSFVGMNNKFSLPD